MSMSEEQLKNLDRKLKRIKGSLEGPYQTADGSWILECGNLDDALDVKTVVGTKTLELINQVRRLTISRNTKAIQVDALVSQRDEARRLVCKYMWSGSKGSVTSEKHAAMLQGWMYLYPEGEEC